MRPSFIVFLEWQGHRLAQWLPLLQRTGGKPEGPLHWDLALEIRYKEGLGLYATHDLRIFFKEEILAELDLSAARAFSAALSGAPLQVRRAGFPRSGVSCCRARALGTPGSSVAVRAP